MKNRPFLFSISATFRVMHDICSDDIVSNLMSVFSDLTSIEVACYRAGCSVTELLVHRESTTPFCLTIWQGELSVSPVSDDDLRLSHKEISLPDSADVLLLITTLVRRTGLVPKLIQDPHSSVVMEFIRHD